MQGRWCIEINKSLNYDKAPRFQKKKESLKIKKLENQESPYPLNNVLIRKSRLSHMSRLRICLQPAERSATL